MLGTYAALLWAGVPVVALMAGLGLALAASMAALAWRARGLTRRLRPEAVPG
jgi:hypothetical protein